MNRKLNRLLQPGFSVYVGILVLCAAAALFLQQYYLAIAEAGGALLALV